jgi:dipeptidyl aminopeptidase/acylaminoacyl peptidase
VTAFVTDSGYLEVEDARAKAGDAVGESTLVAAAIATGKAVDVELPCDPAGLRADGVWWSSDGAWCVIEARSFDRSHRMLLRLDPATGKTTVLRHDHDPAWVLGHALGFCGGTSRFAFLSEAGGFRNLCVVDVADGGVRTIAAGAFEVDDAALLADGRTALALARIDGPHAAEIVQLDLEASTLTRLTRDAGLRDLAVSPDGAWLAEVRSKPDRPWELFVRKRDAVDAARQVTDSPSPAFKSFAGWRAPPIVAVAGEGGTFPARLYPPKDGARGGPGAVFIHGAGYLQNVHDGWSSYQREYAFHHLLAERGFTVIDLDYRGSAGYGRDFRAAVKGRVGELDTLDVVACARRLVEIDGCDPRRIHCYGGSYGGFLTLMALFKHPGVFRSGAALRPVTDWSHYHEGYTANLLDDPLDDEDVYRRASPLTFAAGLRDRLLICHGLLDDNVLPQDTIRLTQRLIELRKTDFEVMLYPWERHAFTDAASWSDEYRRILALFER